MLNGPETVNSPKKRIRESRHFLPLFFDQVPRRAVIFQTSLLAQRLVLLRVSHSLWTIYWQLGGRTSTRAETVCSRTLPSDRKLYVKILIWWNIDRQIDTPFIKINNRWWWMAVILWWKYLNIWILLYTISLTSLSCDRYALEQNYIIGGRGWGGGGV